MTERTELQAAKLTDEDIGLIAEKHGADDPSAKFWLDFARDIESAASLVAGMQLSEAPTEQILWCVHVIGPDDLYAFPTLAAAQENAKALAAFMDRQPKTAHDPICIPVVTVWPHSPESHAADIRENVFSAALPTAPGAAVPEGCTPADAMVLREANHALAQESCELQNMVRELLRQINEFVEENGEANFYTGEANKLMKRFEAGAAGLTPVEAKSLLTDEDANNYSLILTLLGMEEEGDPVAEVGILLAERAAAAAPSLPLPVATTPEAAQSEPDYRAMFGAAIASLAEISHALGIDEEEAACANGNELILDAIARKNEAIMAAITRPAAPKGELQDAPSDLDLTEPVKAMFPCEDCDGEGEVGEPQYQGEFQPPERARCPTCRGSGNGGECLAYHADEVNQVFAALRAAALQGAALTAEPLPVAAPLPSTSEKDWSLRMAALEDGQEVGAGAVGVQTDADALDAKRYRRIRNGPHSDNYGDLYGMTFQGDGDVPVTGAELDAACDAALRRAAGNSKEGSST